MHRLPLRGLLLVAVLSGWPPLPTPAATYHISPTPTGPRLGMPSDAPATPTPGAKPWSFAEFTAKLQPGDVVQLHGGIYPPLWIKCEGTAEKPISFGPVGDGPVIIQGRITGLTGLQRVPGSQRTYVTDMASKPSVVAVNPDAPPYPLVSFRSRYSVASLAELDQEPQQTFYDRANRKLYVSVAGGSPEGLVALRDSTGLLLESQYAVVDGLVISGFGDSGVWTAKGTNAVYNLRVSLCFNSGIYGDRQCDSLIAQDCVIYRCHRALTIGGPERIPSVVFRHNTVWWFCEWGIGVLGCHDSVVSDNIAAVGPLPSSSAGPVLGVLDPVMPRTIASDHNCLFRTRQGIAAQVLVIWGVFGGHSSYADLRSYQRGEPGQDQHSTSADPLFACTELGKEDFTLQPKSPCRGKASDGTDMGARGRALKP